MPTPLLPHTRPVRPSGSSAALHCPRPAPPSASPQVLYLFDANTPPYETNCRQLASRVMSFFVRHAALHQPMSEEGKMKLSTDIAQVLAPPPPPASGPPLAMHKCPRPLAPSRASLGR